MIEKRELASCSFTLVLGVFLAHQSSQLTIWTESGPGEGFFPLVAAISIIGLSLAIFFNLLIFAQGKKSEVVSKKEEKETKDTKKVFAYIILALSYGLLMQAFGFLIPSIILIFCILKFIEKQSWKVSTLVTMVSIISSYFLFSYFLNVPLS